VRTEPWQPGVGCDTSQEHFYQVKNGSKGVEIALAEQREANPINGNIILGALGEVLIHQHRLPSPEKGGEALELMSYDGEPIIAEHGPRLRSLHTDVYLLVFSVGALDYVIESEDHFLEAPTLCYH
jgi:hypothetical protein